MTELVNVEGIECELISDDYQNILTVRMNGETALATKSTPHTFILKPKLRYDERGKRTARQLSRRPNGKGWNH